MLRFWILGLLGTRTSVLKSINQHFSFPRRNIEKLIGEVVPNPSVDVGSFLNLLSSGRYPQSSDNILSITDCQCPINRPSYKQKNQKNKIVYTQPE